MSTRLIAAIVLLAASPAFAAPAPLVITHHGRLFDNNDQPVSGVVHMKWGFYKNAQPPGLAEDEAWWVSNEVPAVLFNGLYSIQLGHPYSGTGAIPESVFAGEGERWLGVTVEGQPLLPRFIIAPVPWSLSSNRALEADHAAAADRLGAHGAADYALAADVESGLTAARAHADSGDAAGLLDAKAYADEGAAAGLAAAKGHADTGDAAGLAAAKEHADLGAAAALADAKGYADTGDATALAGAKGYADTGDATTLGGAKGYADTGDAATLASAKGYADSSFALKTDTAPNSLKLGTQLPSFYATAAHDHDGTYVKLAGSGDFTITGMGTFGSMGLMPQTSAPPACNDSTAGRIYYDQAGLFYGCNGRSWNAFGGCLDGSGSSSAARSCKDVKTCAPTSGDGQYWIDIDGPGANPPFQAVCDMTRDGGGWTLGVKSWYTRMGDGSDRTSGAVGSIADALARKGNIYKLSDDAIRGIIGASQNFDIMGDQNGYNSAYSNGNYEYVIVRNYTARWSWVPSTPASTTTTTMQSYRISDNALAWTGNLACGKKQNCTDSGNRDEAGINCYDVLSNSPQGGSGCTINMGKQSDGGWHHFFMSECNTDTYLYICNGAQHSSSFDMNHRWWFRGR